MHLLFKNCSSKFIMIGNQNNLLEIYATRQIDMVAHFVEMLQTDLIPSCVLVPLKIGKGKMQLFLFF